MNLYEYWDSLSAECDNFHEYAWNHLDDFITDFEAKRSKKVVSTYFSGLGIASPSKMTKYIIRKYKCGRVIKNVKPGQLYKVTYFDSEGSPLAVENYDEIIRDSADVGRSGTRYFVKYGNAVWTAWFSERGSLFNEHYKILYDEKQRLKGFYKMNAGNSLQVMAEEYDYSEIESGIVTCLFTNYLGKSSGSSKDIPVGNKGAPAIQWKYVIEVNEKGEYTSLTVYKNINGDFVFNEHVDFE
ncbi:MAG: hypothetical protein J6B01_07060 [Ruminococcus sp.]|nr:hypothetical protein [Ruminococcus sp.]